MLTSHEERTGQRDETTQSGAEATHVREPPLWNGNQQACKRLYNASRHADERSLQSGVTEAIDDLGSECD